jgi:hypothetical protein
MGTLSLGVLAVAVSQEMKVKGCSNVAQTHNTSVEMIRKFNKDTRKFVSKLLKGFQHKIRVLIVKIVGGPTAILLLVACGCSGLT